MSLPHDSAHTHVTGRSEYIDDRIPLKNEVYLEILYSPHAYARIEKIDSQAALKVPGVCAVLTAEDIVHNLWGTIFKDQPLIAQDEVHFVGETVAIIAGETREAAAQGRALVQVKYRVLEPVLSIRDARAKRSFIGSARKIECGKVDEALKHATHRLQGSVVIRGADHFYLESQAALAYPLESGQIEVHSSSQHPTETQHVVAHALGVAASEVVCIVKRMGGAFGGKESQAAPYAAYAALVAKKLGRPARLILNKDDDMVATGKRNPFENEYEVGFDQQGKILALDVRLFSDGGAYADLSTSIMERAMLHIDSAYYVPNLRVAGQVCRTHYHPHTAFRGFGGPKGVATMERIIEEIAHVVGKDPLEIRKLNCYTDQEGRNLTHYGQVVQNNCLTELFNKLEKDSAYYRRREEIRSHNQKASRSGGALRGLSLTPVKFGISFTTRFLNQANALVIVHRDGSLQVSTGATEMGQGVNARIAELVAREFGLERQNVRIMPTATDKNGNTSPTAASSGTDLNGAAALLAVRKIKERLSELALRLFQLPEAKWAKNTAGLGTEPEIRLNPEPFYGRDLNNPNQDTTAIDGVYEFKGVAFEGGQVFLKSRPESKISFDAVVNEAYLNRISLSEYAHYRFNGLSFDKLSGKGDAFLYFTQGVAASEVSVDPDTGEVKVLRSDILMDLGRPVNEGLDLGQVTGGFVQGMGWVTTEKLYYSSAGALLSHSPSTYKIPSVQDTPRIFKVELLENFGNTVNVRGTKAVGEPPLLLALSVWTAIHDAIKDLDHYKQSFPLMELPATQEQVLRAISPERFAQWELQ